MPQTYSNVGDCKLSSDKNDAAKEEFPPQTNFANFLSPLLVCRHCVTGCFILCDEPVQSSLRNTSSKRPKSEPWTTQEASSQHETAFAEPPPTTGRQSEKV